MEVYYGGGDCGCHDVVDKDEDEWTKLYQR